MGRRQTSQTGAIISSPNKELREGNDSKRKLMIVIFEGGLVCLIVWERNHFT
jgi:hypothetical protein